MRTKKTTSWCIDGWDSSGYDTTPLRVFVEARTRSAAIKLCKKKHPGYRPTTICPEGHPEQSTDVCA